MLKIIPKVLKALPFVGKYVRELEQYRQEQACPPGHYYSPLPSREEVRAREQAIWGPVPRSLPGIDLNEEGQLALLEELRAYYPEMPFGEEPRPGLRYSFANVWFGHPDAVALYCMLRHLKPRRVIEVGSGHSSAVILDTNDLFFGGRIACTFIDPEPARLLSLLKGGDRGRHTLIPARVQDVDPGLFGQLAANDVLFVDSSHVAKVGSDVNRVLFSVLPALARDVSVHFHDVIYPFEYPKEWVYEGVAWNESYLVRAFLQYNAAFRVQFFTSFLAHFHRGLFARDMPLCLKSPSQSLWLKKVV
jgi:hypothetical protein